jgi:uncharacterized protein (TIGR03085 family)
MPPESDAQEERATLCDLFEALGPEAPTLCAGWTTRDLAAHLVVRERRPDSGPGLVWPPLSGYTDRVRGTVRDQRTWPELVERVRNGPPALLKPFDAAMNTVEFFIHVEDVRRAQPEWEPRALGPSLAEALWKRVGPRGMAKAVEATVEVTAPGREPKVAGTGPRLVVSGDPGELTLFGAGRQAAARVEMAGPNDLAERLRTASLGI